VSEEPLAQFLTSPHAWKVLVLARPGTVFRPRRGKICGGAIRSAGNSVELSGSHR